MKNITINIQEPHKRKLAEIRSRMEPLSKKAQEARKPTPPEYLVDALQDPVHKEVGRSRSAKVIKRKNNENKSKSES